MSITRLSEKFSEEGRLVYDKALRRSNEADTSIVKDNIRNILKDIKAFQNYTLEKIA